MKRRFFIRTFGCQMNKHDSERIAGLLLSGGHHEANSIEKADLVIFNTCAVREHAEERLFGNINALAEQKKFNPELLIAVGGCVAQKEKERIYKFAPVTDIVFGTFNIEELNRLIEEAEEKNERVLSLNNEFNVMQTGLPSRRGVPFLAWVPVSIGCSNYCAYCVVPYVRGEERSRPREEILGEVENLVQDGVVELTLIGQNVNSYGSDLYCKNSFAELLEEVSGIPGLQRVRFATSHPKDLTDETIEVIAGNKNICRFIHLPVQSGSNRILKAMNRGYTREHYLALIEKIRRALPDVSLGTDFITGFPGETDEDFEQTYELARESGFDSMFTFIYSPRKGTAAYEMQDDVPRAKKVERVIMLGELLQETAQLSNSKYLNTNVQVLVEGKAKKGRNIFTGRTMTNRVVNFPGEKSMTGKIMEVRITETASYSLTGEVVDKADK